MQLPVDYSALEWSQRRDVRNEYVNRQKGLCHHCKGSLEDQPPASIRAKKINWRLFPANFLKYPVHLHHDHKSGMTIGAVHNYCNAVLWQYHGE